MTDFESMTEKELNKVSAQMFGELKTTRRDTMTRTDEFDSYQFGDDRFTLTGVYGTEIWRPTHRGSNQAERYLFAKLLEKGFNINIEFRKHDYFWVNLNRTKPDYGFIDVEENCEDPDQINRTTTICCLKAMEHLNKEEGNPNEKNI